ncbi:MAG TPA: hypothetical protein VFE05_21395 [Longimicrobiaceae bacterium]|jgi:hypothetical protein|nr:hypothetical protein [Longimicrobiaceae bacterium]
MRLTMIKGLRNVALAAVVASGAGCASMGSVGNVLGSILNQGAGGAGGTGQIDGQVRYVDQQRQSIQVQTQDGQTGNVSYDNRTVVVFGQQQYAVTSLEQGDYISMRVQQANGGVLYTDQIVVQRNVRDTNGSGTYGSGNGGYGTGYQQLTGNVGQVDYSRGVFEVRTNQGTYTAAMPYNPNASDRDRFQRLRSGDYVRLEGTANGSRFEVTRFL